MRQLFREEQNLVMTHQSGKSSDTEEELGHSDNTRTASCDKHKTESCEEAKVLSVGNLDTAKTVA